MRLIREWGALLAIFAAGAVTGLAAWAFTAIPPDPALPCSSGLVAAACPQGNPALHRDPPAVRVRGLP
jgi:hypothetical protein